MIKKAEIKDLSALIRLASSLWSDCPESELSDSFADILDNDDCACFIKYVDNQAVGFAQCGLRRDYVEGASSSPVGYLEGIFIKEGFRKRGFAKQLLENCENWARAKGCKEFAGDCELHNKDSLAFHLRNGFKEASRIICFVKKI